MKRAKYYTDEWCPECEREVRIPARVKPMPKCPKCHKDLLPCSACDDETHRRCSSCTDGDCKFKLHPGFKAKKTGFTLKALLKVADKAYDSSVVLSPAVATVDVGDTLASFIVREIKDTFDVWATKQDQLQEAARVLLTATNQLDGVRAELNKCWYRMNDRTQKRKIQKRRKEIKK